MERALENNLAVLIDSVTHKRCLALLSVDLPICKINEDRYCTISILLVHVTINACDTVWGRRHYF